MTPPNRAESFTVTLTRRQVEFIRAALHIDIKVMENTINSMPDTEIRNGSADFYLEQRAAAMDIVIKLTKTIQDDFLRSHSYVER